MIIARARLRSANVSQARFDGDRLALVVEVSHVVSTANRLTDRYYRMLTTKESGDPSKIRITVDEFFVPATDTDSSENSDVSGGTLKLSSLKKIGAIWLLGSQATC